MKKKCTTTKSQLLQEASKRLTAYSAAAGLGAFACGETADAAIIYVDPADIVVNETSPTGGYFDMNGDAVLDFRFRFQPSGGATARVRFQGVYGSADLTNSPAKGSTYYVRSFELGDLIGSTALDTGNTNGLVSSNSSNFGNPTNPQYAGIKLLIGADTHYGWVRLKTEPVDLNGAPVPPLTGTIFDWAYESEPNTSIPAGSIPEPSSLALLAAGAGALALRRRK